MIKLKASTMVETIIALVIIGFTASSGMYFFHQSLLNSSAHTILRERTIITSPFVEGVLQIEDKLDIPYPELEIVLIDTLYAPANIIHFNELSTPTYRINYEDTE